MHLFLSFSPLTHGRFLDPYFKLRGIFFSGVHTQHKDFQGQEFSGMGCVTIFYVEGKKTKAGRGVQRPYLWVKGLKQYYYLMRRLALFTKFCVAWLNYPPPSPIQQLWKKLPGLAVNQVGHETFKGFQISNSFGIQCGPGM